jgi:tetratricopeptide (TPR) repeat protein
VDFLTVDRDRRYVFGRGQLDEAIAFFQSALNIVQNISMEESETKYYLIRRVHNGIGTTCAEINRPEDCLKHQTIVADLLMTRNSTLGVPVDDYPTAIAHNELGVAKAFNGDLEGAERAFLLSITTYQQNPNYEDVWLGWPMPNLGFIYWLQGRLTEARQILEEVLDIFKLAYGVDDVTSFR